MGHGFDGGGRMEHIGAMAAARPAALEPIRAAALVFALAALGASGPAGATEIAVGGAVFQGWGTSTWGLDASQQVDGVAGDVIAQSRLAWPLTGTDVGLDVTWQADGGRSGHWGGWVRAHVMVTDPIGRMVDEDWLTAKGLDVDKTMISYTESKVQGGSFVGDAGFYLSLYPAGEIPALGEWDLHFGYRHEVLNLDAWGVDDGWQLGQNGAQVPVSLDPHTLAAEFDGHHLYPYVGVLYRVRAGKRFRCEVRGVGTGFVSIEKDDHVLRSKRMNSLGWGLGALVGARPEWVFEKDRKTGKGATVSVGLGLEVQYARTLTGTIEQEYYSDDPGFAGDQTQQEIPDSDYYAQVLRVAGGGFLKIIF